MTNREDHEGPTELELAVLDFVGTAEINDDPVPDVQPDLVPTCDDGEPVATYRDWRPEFTRVLTYRIGNDLYPRDPRVESRDEAMADAVRRFGRVLEANFVPGRAFLRVPRLAAEVK